MIFRYNGFSEADGAVKITIPRPTQKRTELGGLQELTYQWMIEGEIIADTPAEITTQIQRRIAAYNADGGDALLLMSDGSPSAHSLINSQAIGGVKSSGIFFPAGDGPEYVNGRVWSLVLEATFGAWFGAGGNKTPQRLGSFMEQVTIIGDGGPRRVVIETLNTKPVEQVVMKHTLCRATQSGTATYIGGSSHPVPPPPIWDYPLDPTVTRLSPKVMGEGKDATLEWTTSWSYNFVSPTPLKGLPNSRKG